MSNIVDLVNLEFPLKYNGQEYLVRKATIKQVIMYQERLLEIQGKPSVEQRISAYCVYLILKPYIPDLTEDSVLDNMPGDTDYVDIITGLGFMKPEKLEMVKRLQEEAMRKLIGQKSLLLSPTEQDGPPK